MKSIRPILALIALAGLAAGCTTSGMVNASALSAALTPVMDRHDNYVAHDPALSELEKATYLRSTAITRDILKVATPSSTVPPAITATSAPVQ